LSCDDLRQGAAVRGGTPLDRIAGNTRLTTAGLGTLDLAAVPSGYAQLALGRTRSCHR
jgi:hypothetical protein